MKINPQNELGDIMSEPCVNLNRFQVVIYFYLNQIGFFILVQRILMDFAGFGGLKPYLWAFVKTNPRNELGDMISEPYAKFNRFGVINQIGFFIVVQKVV